MMLIVTMSMVMTMVGLVTILVAGGATYPVNELAISKSSAALLNSLVSRQSLDR